MRSLALVLGWSPCRVGGSSSRSIRVVVALAVAMMCVGWSSSVTVATEIVCVESYCRDVGLLCTLSGTNQQQRCCIYSCAPDESCSELELRPLNDCVPPEVNVDVCVHSGAPGCTVVEAKTTVTNQSPYYYKLNMWTTAGSQAIWGCSGCERTESNEEVVLPPLDDFAQSVTMWNCGEASCEELACCHGDLDTVSCCNNCPANSTDPACPSKCGATQICATPLCQRT